MIFKLAFAALAAARMSEVWTVEQNMAAGIDYRFDNHDHGNLMAEHLPEGHNWCDLDGKSYCTMNRNQHIPQYCGSCWAHGSVSALADRVKIARNGTGIDINPSVQHILNCANVGSCHGGSVPGPYHWLLNKSEKTGVGISYETSNPYLACSSESQEGICPGNDWSCTDMNVAKTCSTFPPEGKCAPIVQYPHITIKNYGTLNNPDDMAKEIYKNGPIACGIDAAPILNYTTGIVSDAGEEVDHVVSVVGWETDKESGKQYWIVRNSWGEYWGDMGFIYVEKGNNALHLEEQCAWATVDQFTTVDNQVRCYEGGENCQ